MPEHILTVFNAVDVPDTVAREVMTLLATYDPDIYTRTCNRFGVAGAGSDGDGVVGGRQ
jgi:hypothetical protein